MSPQGEAQLLHLLQQIANALHSIDSNLRQISFQQSQIAQKTGR